jgi:phosphate transport system substrate-binding protein
MQSVPAITRSAFDETPDEVCCTRRCGFSLRHFGSLCCRKRSPDRFRCQLPAPIYLTWFKDFSKNTAGVTVDYQSKGSGAGVQDFLNKTVDFAASDSAMSEEDIAKVAKACSCCQ